MAERIEIQCINKRDRYNPHERITHVGGFHGGQAWRLTEDDAIAGIENGKWAFYVTQRGYTVDVIVATHLGHKYLKTVADGQQPDNLLSLPECPG